MNPTIVDTPSMKLVRSDGYNYNYDKESGLFVRWGNSPDDDPQYGPFGPEILDMEISTGDCSGRCPWCYKSNSVGDGHHMDFDTFRNIFDKIAANRVLSQIAFGITDADANKDFPEMIRYCVLNGVVPNYTTSGYGMTPEFFDLSVQYCGAVAVSAYPGTKELAYDTIQEFAARGMDQVNMHLLYYEENLPFCYKVLKDIWMGDKLDDLNAVVLLALKPVGRAAEGFTPVNQREFSLLSSYAYERGVPFGFDSCSAPKFVNWVEHTDMMTDKQKKLMIMVSESCESGLFSSYINVDGEFWPCSFTEGQDWFDPINVTEIDDFVEDVWYAPQTVSFRKRLLATTENDCRHCPVFDI